MADLTLPLIGLITIGGYLLKQKQNESMSENYSNIYHSNESNKVSKEMLNRAQDKFDKARNPAFTGIFAPLVGSVGQNTLDLQGTSTGPSQQELYNDTKFGTVGIQKTVIQEPKAAPTKVFTKTLQFTTFDPNAAPKIDPNANHSNMVPFSKKGDYNINTEKFTDVLNNYNGTSPIFNPSKKEHGPLFEPRRQDTIGITFADKVDKSRYSQAMSMYQAEGVKPFQPNRIAAPVANTIDNPIKYDPKTIDELRPVNTKMPLSQPALLGQKGSNRGIQAKFDRNKPATAFENNHILNGKSSTVAPAPIENHSQFKGTMRQDTQGTNYVGNGNSIVSEGYIPLQNYKGSFKNETVNNQSLNVSGTKNRDAKSLQNTVKNGMYTTERENTDTKPIVNANKSTFGHTVTNQTLPKTTLRNTLGKEATNLNVHSTVKNQESRDGIQAKTTIKEMSVLNNYIGNANKNDNMGYLVNKFDAKTTLKELTSDNKYLGHSNSSIQNPESRNLYNNVTINDSKELAVSGQRMSGQGNSATPIGAAGLGQVTMRANTMIKESLNKQQADFNNITNVRNNIPSKNIQGNNTKNYGKEFANTRLNPELIEYQLNQNPLYIKTRK